MGMEKCEAEGDPALSTSTPLKSSRVIEYAPGCVLSQNWLAGFVLQHQVCPTIPILWVRTLSIPWLWFCRIPGSQTTGLGLDDRRSVPFATVVSALQHLDDFSTSTRILVGGRCVSVGRTLGRAIEPFGGWCIFTEQTLCHGI